MKEVTGKVAFITGGASGIGLAIARSLAGAGMKIAIADIQQDALSTVQEEFDKSNFEVITIKTDVGNRNDMENAANKTEEAFGKVHVVCNNAGVVVGGSIDQMSYSDWDWVMNVNLQGVINGVQTFVERIRKHGEGGHIVNTASLAGHFAIPGLSIYNTTKYAVVGLSETMRLELAPQNIGVSVLCPGVVNTNIGDSERNRPPELKSDRPSEPLFTDANSSDEERQARFEQILKGALEPAVVGDMVLAGIQNDDLYIFPHPELRAQVETRMNGIMQAFDRWQAYRRDLE